MNSVSNIINNIKLSLADFYNQITNKQSDIKIKDEIRSKYSTLQTKITQEYEDLVNSENYKYLEDNKKQNALFNLRFEDYKIGVKEQLLYKANLLDSIVYNDPYCKEPVNNTYIFIGIVMIVIAILFSKIA